MLVPILMYLVAVATATTVPTEPASVSPTPPTCERAPAHAQPADTSYRLGIDGEPDFYLPGELYTVTLKGVDSGQGPTPFIGFTIWTEIDEELAKSDNNYEIDVNGTLGVFQAYDAQTKPHKHCRPAVDNATAHPKTDIQIIWSAPSKITERCVRICARAFPVSSGPGSVLARKICLAPVQPALRMPAIFEPCCACDEAKYEVTFEGLWSRNTHPHEFPPESAQAHFGDVIGASHTAQYRVWQEGRIASIGLRRLAEDGATTALEKELKAESDHIRTIIKARGISWQQITGAGTSNTFAVFRVDAKHHLVSLASKLSPSPDWIVGVSALELCNLNCTWTSSATLELFPYDAGTDSGISYVSRRQPTVPPAPVRALRPNWPRDPRSPFFSATGEMRPFARLRLNRLQLFEKNCDASSSDVHPETSGGAVEGGTCATHAWGPWGACSATCGTGHASRQRRYVWPARALADACRVPLTQYRRCHGARTHCRAVSEFEPAHGARSGPCALSAWSAWSPCAGCGVRARSRHYLRPRAHKRCHTGYRSSVVTSEAMPCDAGPCYKPAKFSNSTNYDWFFLDQPSWPCKVTPWGEWSPCSARCGRGHRMRTRLYIAIDSRAQAELSRRLLYRWNQRFAELQQLDFPTVNLTVADPEIEALVNDQLEKCQFTLTLQEALCDGEDTSCIDAENPLEVCKLPVAVGHCRGYVERWFYDASRGACEPFGYSGCGGNVNNFPTVDHCRAFCHNNIENRTETTTAATVSSLTTPSDVIIKKLKPALSSEDNEVIQNDDPLYHDEDGKCEMGPWLGWSECFGECDYGVKLNYRLVKMKSSKSSELCRKLVKSRKCKPMQCHRMFDAAHATQSVSTEGQGRK